eukprot:symbB.v1.2.014809.t1/scaffold1091.1/size138789/4
MTQSWALPASSCWEKSELHPVRCCLGTDWGFKQEQVDECWVDGNRTFESCCLTERILPSLEIRQWQQGATDCGCLMRDTNPLLTSMDFFRCVPGVLVMMLADLAGHAGIKDVSERPSLYYLNHALPYALEATSSLLKTGWNLIPLLKSVKAIALIARYAMQSLQGLGQIHPSFCDLTPPAVAFFGDVHKAVGEQDRRLGGSVVER